MAFLRVAAEVSAKKAGGMASSSLKAPSAPLQNTFPCNIRRG